METTGRDHGTLPARSTGADRRFAAVYIGAFCLVLLGLLRAPFRSGVFWMKYLQDDLFYYLKVAQNIASGRGSTFNGIVPTNGYHPLYEALLVLLSCVTRSPHGILLSEAGLIFGASLATLLLSIKLLRQLDVALLNALAFAAWVTIYSLRIFYNGMEVTLTIPLALAFVIVAMHREWWAGRLWRSMCLGLLGSGLVLSRLDSLLLIALVFSLMVCYRETRAAMLRHPGWKRSFSGLLLGFAPVLLYFAWNRFVFGGFLPVSAESKQLKPGLVPSLSTWAGLNLNRPAYLAVTAPAIIALLAAPLLRRFAPQQRCVLLALLLFPWLFYLLVSMRSDWPLWPWYLYPLRLATVAALALLAAWPLLAGALRNRAVAIGLAVVCFVPLFFDGWRIQLSDLYDRAEQVAAFASTHPGVYAMGDGAGAVGYLLQQPVVQLEGLMMDRDYLRLLRTQPPLDEVLRKYHVDYYVGTYYTRSAAHPDADPAAVVPDCFRAEEPLLAGPRSPKSRGRICQAALLHTNDPETGLQTVIYRISEP